MQLVLHTDTHTHSYTHSLTDKTVLIYLLFLYIFLLLLFRFDAAVEASATIFVDKICILHLLYSLPPLRGSVCTFFFLFLPCSLQFFSHALCWRINLFAVFVVNRSDCNYYDPTKRRFMAHINMSIFFNGIFTRLEKYLN